MSAAYDTYDYPRYWVKRSYEHESEIIAIKEFLSRYPKFDTLADIGCGYGRLVESYSDFASSITCVDPSGKLLEIAKLQCEGKTCSFKKSTVQDLDKKMSANVFDAVVSVRVMHHVEELDLAFKNLNRIMKKNGVLVLEFANKLHGKALIGNFLKGNLTFPLEIFPLDKRSKKNIKEKSIPFLNHHPSIVKEKLEENGFEIVELRSVSNFRAAIFKKMFPLWVLLLIEKFLQRPLAKIYFGPSMFVLAKKK